MKDRDAFLELMIADYEESTGVPLSVHDPIYHAFNSVSNVADIMSVYADKEARERYIVTAKRRNSVIAHAIGMGYTPVFLEPDQHTQQVIFSDAIPEDLYIPKHTRIRTELEGDSYVIAEVIQDVLVPQGSTSTEFTVEVGQTVEEYIGAGTGTEIVLPLDGDFVYVNSLTLKVVTSLGTETWTKVDNFLQSDDQDNHFIIEVGAKNFNDMMKPNDLMLYIRCGDGNSGRIFPKNSQIYAVYKEVSPYQTTMPLNTLTVFEDSINYVETTSNIEVVKEKVMPEDIEIIRRNAIYTKSIGNTLETKEDFERATILQSNNKIFKAYAEASISGDQTIYTIYVRGDVGVTLTQTDLDSTRDRMYSEYARSLNSVYNLVVAPTYVGTLEMTVMYQPDTLDTRKSEIKESIKDIVANTLAYLDLGKSYTVPVLWNNIIKETNELLKGLAYLQINTTPPTIPYNAELVIDRASITFVEQ